MFDTMTLTKVVGGLCGALLIFLMGKWAAETMYHTGGGHGDDHHAAYVIDTGDGDDHGGEAAEEGPSLAEMYAAADIAKGEKVFGKCKACHKREEGANSTGPYLFGVVGRDVGTADGFGYSGSLVAVADVWTPETLNGFLESPKKYAPGTTMAFSGLGKAKDRVNLIAYLDQLDGDMTEMEAPAMEEAHAEESAAEEAHAEEAAAEEPAAEEAMAEEPAAEEEAAAEEPAAEEEAMAEEPAAEEPAAMAMAGDVDAGAKVYKKCKACHSTEDGKNRVGPHLFGIMGRDVASAEGFKYSDAMKGVGGTWTPEQMDTFLTKPKELVPGTKMSFAGLKKEEDRANLMAYLATFGN